MPNDVFIALKIQDDPEDPATWPSALSRLDVALAEGERALQAGSGEHAPVNVPDEKGARRGRKRGDRRE